MQVSPITRHLDREARGLLTRLVGVQPFSLTMPMVGAAGLPAQVMNTIDNFLITGRRQLAGRVKKYLRWLRSPAGQRAGAEEQQRRFMHERLIFDTKLAQLDIYADVLNQRAEHVTGVWLAGLDEFAADALRTRGNLFERPALIVYLERGHGAAIRRAHTRLPGGGDNPVAIVRIPRERMVGHAIGGSLVHEVGHQVAALLELVSSLKTALREQARKDPASRRVWTTFGNWISEIVADYWALGNLGVGATLGLMGVVSLPKAMVFRRNATDPHPTPWVRVMMSCAFGRDLYPDPQWTRLERIWEKVYPPGGSRGTRPEELAAMRAKLPELARLIRRHRAKSLRGKTLKETLPVTHRSPDRLRGLWRKWCGDGTGLLKARPTLAVAVLGQARADGHLTPAAESRVLQALFKRWALIRSGTEKPQEIPLQGMNIGCRGTAA